MHAKKKKKMANCCQQLLMHHCVQLWTSCISHASTQPEHHPSMACTFEGMEISMYANTLHFWVQNANTRYTFGMHENTLITLLDIWNFHACHPCMPPMHGIHLWMHGNFHACKTLDHHPCMAYIFGCMEIK